MIEKLMQIEGHWRFESISDGTSCEMSLQVDGMETIKVVSYECDLPWAFDTMFQIYESQKPGVKP